MPDKTVHRFLFVVNKKSGPADEDWAAIINDYFKDSGHHVDFYHLPEDCEKQDIMNAIERVQPTRVIAVGGDGTVKLVAECIMDKDIALGILPAGSANGMATELGIEAKPAAALQVAVNGIEKRIHLVKVNEEISIHLSDLGFNAFMMKEFEQSSSRGMWGYLKASWGVLWKHAHMDIELKVNGTLTKKTAAMVVIANATKYGTGALINPGGRLDDELFEVIIIKKLSLKEIFKMMVTHQPYDPAKTEVHQTDSISIAAARPMHFQVDGEYLGKVSKVKATLLPAVIKMVVPAG